MCVFKCILYVYIYTPHTHIKIHVYTLYIYTHAQTVFPHKLLCILVGYSWKYGTRERLKTLGRELWSTAGCLLSILPDGFWLTSKEPSWGRRAQHSGEPRVARQWGTAGIGTAWRIRTSLTYWQQTNCIDANLRLPHTSMKCFKRFKNKIKMYNYNSGILGGKLQHIH